MGQIHNPEALIRQCRLASAYAEQGTTAALNAQIGALEGAIRALCAAQVPTHRDLSGGTLYTIEIHGTEIQVSATVTGGNDWDGFNQPYTHVDIHGYWIKGARIDGDFLDDYISEIEEKVVSLAQAGAAAAALGVA